MTDSHYYSKIFLPDYYSSSISLGPFHKYKTSSANINFSTIGSELEFTFPPPPTHNMNCRISPKNSSVSSNGGNSSHKSSHKSNSSSSSSNSSSSSSTTGQGNSKHRINGLKSLVQDPKLIKALSIDLPGSGSALVTAANGDVLEGGRPLSAGNHKVHLPSGKKQALVKAVPRVDQGSSTTSDLEHKMHKVGRQECVGCVCIIREWLVRC